jgi:hypothetical protein
MIINRGSVRNVRPYSDKSKAVAGRRCTVVAGVGDGDGVGVVCDRPTAQESVRMIAKTIIFILLNKVGVWLSSSETGNDKDA